MLAIFTLVGLPAGASQTLSKLVPKEIDGWSVHEKDGIYSGKEIYKYIDGAGEVYLAYDFRQVLVRRFSKSGEPDIVVELFDMGSPNDAYGVFSHDREMETNEIGQGCERRGGLLSFWKGKYVVTIFAEGQSEASQSAVTDVAKSIAGRIKMSSSKPALLDYLPTQGLQANSIRYFHKHSILNYHYFVAEENILNLHENTECVLAKYKVKNEGCFLLLLRYPKPEDAQAAQISFLKAYLPEAQDSGIAQTENGKWTGVRMAGQFMVIVFDAFEKADVLSLFKVPTSKIIDKEGASE